jgi:hypothetical protein
MEVDTMRKISILQENYMALDGSVVEALDVAEKQIEEAKKEIEKILYDVFENVEEGEPFHKAPSFLNFKAEFDVLSEVKELKQSLAKLVVELKDVKELPIAKVAKMSKAYMMLHNLNSEDVQDEIEELVFFFDRKYTNIPDSANNDFVVQLSEKSYQEALQKFQKLQEILNMHEQCIMDSFEGKKSEERFKEVMIELAVIKEMLSEGNEALIIQELFQFLTEELSQEEIEYLSNLNEGETLNEGVLSKIRWSFAKFSLKFLSTNSLKSFLQAYYSDKEGKPTNQSKDVAKMSKKEMLKKIKELANKLPEEQKNKVANNPEAKRLEKSGLLSGIIAGIAGFGASMANDGSIKASNAAGAASDAANNTQIADIQSRKASELSSDLENSNFLTKPFAQSRNDEFGGMLNTGSDRIKSMSSSLTGAASALAILSSTLFNIMWGAYIVAGVSAVSGLRKIVKANTLRRDEIIKELMAEKS